VIFIYYFLQLYAMLILARILMSWVPIDPHNSLVATLMQITDPYLNIFRSIIPPLGMIDFSPIIAIMVLQAIARFFFSMA